MRPLRWIVRHRCLRRRRCGAAGLAFLTVVVSGFTAQRAGAQVVSGRVIESGSGRAVVLSRVSLLDTALAIVEVTYTFVLRAPGAGDYWIVVDRLGYRSMIDGIIELGEGGFLPVHLFIQPQPIEMKGLTATARRQRVIQKLTGTGFYERREAGFGNFIGPAEIAERMPSDVPDLLRRMPGPVFQSQGIHGNVPLFRSRGRPVPGAPEGYCVPNIYLDGVVVWSQDFPPPLPSIEELVAVEDIVAVEVYAGGATKPLQWGGTRGNCGAIVFWTEGGGT